MKYDTTTRILFVILLVLVLATAYRVIAPFLTGFTWAAVLVAAFRPFHERLARVLGGSSRAAAAVVTLLVAAFVAVPILAAAVEAVQGGIAAVQWIVTHYQSGGTDLGLLDRWPWVGGAIEHVKSLLGLGAVDLQAVAISGLQKLGRLAAAQGPALVGDAFGLAFSFGVMLLAMPMLFMNGERFSDAVAEALPIPAADARRILGELALMTRSVFMSVVLTAAAQAALGGVALLVFGVPHVASLTAVMFFCALLPAGTAVVWMPAAIWLAVTGHLGKAILMATWGAGVLSTIDNVLRPMFAGKGVKLPMGVLFLGTVGGMLAFGLVGLFLGPIALYMTRELLAILRRDRDGAPATATSEGP